MFRKKRPEKLGAKVKQTHTQTHTHTNTHIHTYTPARTYARETERRFISKNKHE